MLNFTNSLNIKSGTLERDCGAGEFILLKDIVIHCDRGGILNACDLGEGRPG